MAFKNPEFFEFKENLENIHRLKILYDTEKAKNINILEEPVDDIACLLKLFLYQLPEALILPHIASSLIDHFKEDKKSIHGYASALLQLPDQNYAMLKRLLKTLFEVSKYQAINNMSIKDLAFAFGPYLIHPSVEKKDIKKEETKDKEVKKQKEKERKLNKEEKKKKEEMKRLADIEKIDVILKIMETPYELADDIRGLIKRLIKYQSEIFIDESNLSNSKRQYSR